MSRDYELPDRGREYTRSSSFSQPPSPRPPPEPTPELKAQWAETVAANLKGSWKHLAESIAAMTTAHAARDIDGYKQARTDAESGLASLRDHAKVAKERAPDAKGTKVSKQLEQVDQLVEAAQKKLEQAPSAPVPVPPSLSCDGALLAALPPKDRAGPVKQVLETARDQVEQVFRRMPYSDFVAFEKLLRDFPTHEIAVRFLTGFGPEKRNYLLAFLKDPKEKARARAREATMPKPAPVVPPPVFEAARDEQPATDERHSATDEGSKLAAVAVASPSSALSDEASHLQAPASTAAPQHETPESILRHMIERGEPDATAIATLDGTTRRALARRLEHYRLGTGDELGARFARLDHAVRVQILDALRGTTAAHAMDASVSTASSLDKVHDPALALDTPLAFPTTAPIFATNDAPRPQASADRDKVHDPARGADGSLSFPTPSPIFGMGADAKTPAKTPTTNAPTATHNPGPSATSSAPTPTDKVHDPSLGTEGPLSFAPPSPIFALDPAERAAEAAAWSGFLATLSADRFITTPADIVIDGLWKETTSVTLTVRPGDGPPYPSAGAELRVTLANVAGDIVQRDVLPWEAGAPVMPSTTLRLEGVGRHEAHIDVVIGGTVRKRITRPVLVRTGKGTKAASTVSDADIRRAGATMSDADVTTQSRDIRAQMRARERPGADLAHDDEYQRLDAMLSELEWQAHARGGDKGKPLDTGKPEVPQVEDGQGQGSRAEPANLDVDWNNRPALRAYMRDLIERHGFDGARNLALRSTRGAAAIAAMTAEIDALKAEHADEPEAFAADAQAMTLTFLDEKEAEIRGELQRYGIAKTGLHDQGRDMWAARGNETQTGQLQALADEARLLGEMKQTLDRYVHDVEGRPKDGASSAKDPGTTDKIEALALAYMLRLQAAIKTYPSMPLFLQQGKDPNMYSVDEPQRIGGAEMVGPKVGYELGEKLKDIAEVRAKVKKNPHAALGLPKISSLTKQRRHILPGSLSDHVIDDAVARWNEPDWTDRMLMAVQLAVTVGLVVANPAMGAAVAAGEASTAAAAAIAAANIAMVSWDAYTLLQQVGEMRELDAYNNTAIDRAQSLLENPPSGWIVLVTGLFTLTGARSAANELVALAKVKRAAAATDTVRTLLAETGGDLADSRLVLPRQQLEATATEVMGGDAERAKKFVEQYIAQLGGVRRGTTATFDAFSGTVAQADVQRLAQQVGVKHITQVSDATVAVRVVYADRGGRLAVPEIVARGNADVRLVLDHKDTILEVRRYNETIDELRDAMGSATSRADHEVSQEVAKQEKILATRRAALADALSRGDVQAAGKLDDEILFYEGEARYWQDVAARGDHVERGFVEGGDPFKTTKEAIKANYPELPDGYFYRRWSNGGDPTRPSYQVVRGSEAAKGAQAARVKARPGGGWELDYTDDAEKVASKVYDPGTATDEVFTDLLGRSQSLRQYDELMTELERLRGLPRGHYREQMKDIVAAEQKRSSIARRARPGEVDEDSLRHTIKERLRPDVLDYLDSLKDAEASREFQRLSRMLNNSDMGNLGEDWYLRRFAPRGQQHVKASKEALAGGKPPVDIETDRFIDSLLPDGTAVEIKSISGALSDRELVQLRDYLKLAHSEAPVGRAGQQVKRIKYVFNRPEGLRANFEEMLDVFRRSEEDATQFACEVFLADGSRLPVIENATQLLAVRGRL